MTNLGPIVANRICKDLSIVVESALGEGLVERLRGLELGARVLVPEGEGAVGAHRGQRAVHRVECDVVHCVDVLQQTQQTLVKTLVLKNTNVCSGFFIWLRNLLPDSLP